MLARCAATGWLVLLVCGCLGEGDHTRLVSPSPFGSTPPVPRAVPLTQAAHAPAAEEAAKRVLVVGQKIIDANPQIGLRPRFLVAGAPQYEVFHRSGPFKTYEVWVTDGLVRACKTDGQLAAVLCHEVGRIVSEREALLSSEVRLAEDRTPPDVRVGNDSGGAFGASDGTRYAELAKLDRARRRPSAAPPPPDPLVLARGYLTRAGYSADDLAEAAPLLRKAEDSAVMERQLGGR
jgi:hypothetical protein